MLGYEESFELTKDGITVSLINIGEGIHGDYNKEDPEDTNLLRFCLHLDEEVDDRESNCTNLTADASDEIQKRALVLIFKEFYNALIDDRTTSVRPLADWLSWLSDEDFENKGNTELEGLIVKR